MIPNDAKDDHTASDHYAVVHRGGVDWRHRRPDAPEYDKDHIETCVSIVDRPKYTWNVPGSPYQACLSDLDFDRLGKIFFSVIRANAGRSGNTFRPSAVG